MIWLRLTDRSEGVHVYVNPEHITHLKAYDNYTFVDLGADAAVYVTETAQQIIRLTQTLNPTVAESAAVATANGGECDRQR